MLSIFAIICIVLMIISIFIWTFVWIFVKHIKLSRYKEACSYKERYDKWRKNGGDGCPTPYEIGNLYKELYPNKKGFPKGELNYYINPEADIPINPKDMPVNFITDFPMGDSINGTPVMSGNDFGSNIKYLRDKEMSIVNNMVKDSKLELKRIYTPTFKLRIITHFFTVFNDVFLKHKEISSNKINTFQIIYMVYQIITVGASILSILYKIVSSLML